MLNKKVTFNFRSSMFSILLVAFLLLTLSVNVIAANEQAYDYFPMTQNQNVYRASQADEVVAYSGTNSETFEDTIIKTAPSIY